MALVELSAVSKLYDNGSRQVGLQDVTLAIESGEFVSIMGPSGSGKSTLLNLVAGLDRPTSGRIVVADEELSALSEAALARFRRRRIGFVFQFFNLLPSLTVLDNVILPAQLAGESARTVRRRAQVLLTELGMSDRLEAYPTRLSGGERQRVAIARALINAPVLVLADEPTGALDSRTGGQVMGLLADLNERGQTVLLVTHDAKLATSHARRVVTLRDGRIEDDSVLRPVPERRPAELVTLSTGVRSGADTRPRMGTPA